MICEPVLAVKGTVKLSGTPFNDSGGIDMLLDPECGIVDRISISKEPDLIFIESICSAPGNEKFVVFGIVLDKLFVVYKVVLSP